MLNSGWVLTILRSRGFPLPDSDILRSAITGLDQNLANQISSAINSIEKGGGNSAETETVALLGRCLNEKIRVGLVAAGIEHTSSGLLQWCMLNTDAFMKVRKAIDGSDPEVEEVKRAIGIVLTPMRNDDETHAGIDWHVKDRVINKIPVEDAWGGLPVTAKKKTKTRTKQEELKSSYLPAAEGLRKHHVYGKSAALLVEIDIARAYEGDVRQYTLRIEGAKAKSNQVFNWEEKIIFQLTRRELHQVVAMFLGLAESCDLKGHGDAQEKWLRIELQPGGLFVKVGQDKRTVAVPVGVEDLYELGLLGIKVLCMNDPDMQQSTILDVLRLSTRLSSRQK